MNQFMKRLLADRSGNVLMLTGLSFLFLVAIGGAGYDLGKQQLVKQRMQQASDAAAIAGAGMEDTATPAERELMANNIFFLNYPDSYLGIARPAPGIQVVGNNVEVRVPNTNVPTSFMSNLGVNSLPANGFTRARIKTPLRPIDLIMVMDNSGSMAGTDVGADNTLNGDAAISLGYCRSWLASLGYAPFWASYYCGPASPPFYRYSLSGITGLTRVNALRYAADYAAGLLLNPNVDNNQIASVTWNGTLVNSQDFQTSYAPVQNFLRGMFATSTTNSTLGLARAQALGAAGFRAGTVRAVLLLTDGSNYPDPVSYNASSRIICDQLKADGVVVYTIAFGTDVENDMSVRQFLSDCATGGSNGANTNNLGATFFIAPDAATLTRAFDEIVISLRRVRILQ